MSFRQLSFSWIAIGLLGQPPADRASKTDLPAAQPPGLEVLARGPIHEGYAQPLNAQPQPGPIASKHPPAIINEIAPDQKPAGDNVQWISGYWSWDDDQTDYIWVSGLWREPPPGRRWLAGHWQAIDKGWQWVAGFWIPEATQDVQYLPAPPPDLDQGPSAPAPDDNSTYVNGSWTYQGNRYYWRPGYWVGNNPNWVWNSSHYVWTPSGYLYNDGYWDHPLDQRGLLFAPARFGSEWGNQRYVPQYVVNSDFLLGALFVRASAQHYYFGDYFEGRYASHGFTAWPDYRYGHGNYDSNYGYYRHQHASDPRWETGMRDLYHARTSGGVPRPPQTLVQQVQLANAYTVNKTESGQVGQNIHLTNMQSVTALTALPQVNNSRITNLGAAQSGVDGSQMGRVLKLEPVSQEEHARQLQAAVQMRDTANRRREVEGNMLMQGGIPVIHTDAPKRVSLEAPKPQPAVGAQPATPRPATPPAQQQPSTPAPAPRPAPAPAQPQPAPVRRAPPPMPVMPKHEERPIPHYDPPRPPAPPKPHENPQ
jgi:WXXGXW repeat (2 copies)